MKDSKKMSGLELLKSMATSDELVDHDGETCGLCCNMIIMAQTARDMLKDGNFTEENAIEKWATESRKRWEESKFFKLWQEEKAAGRDPNEAFAERGWET